MQIAPLFYWFTDPEWWLGATQGTVGALIGFLGLYWVFRKTREHEIQKDKDAVQREKDQQDEDRLMARVAMILEAVTNVQIAPYRYNEEPAHELAKQLMLFYLEQLRSHEKRAKWALSQFKAMRDRTMPEEDVRAVAFQATAIAAMLSTWVELGLDDDLLDKEEAARTTQELFDELIPEERLTRKELESMTQEEGQKFEDLLARLRG